MRKFILTLFVLGLLVCAALAAVPFFTKVLGPDMMPDAEPPVGLPFGAREFPLPERSLVAVKLDLPVRLLADLANRDIPVHFSGAERTALHQKIRDGMISWKMSPGDVSLENTGKNLSFSLPLNGVANGTGRFGLFKIPVKGDAQMTGEISGNLTPSINTEWQVNPNLATSFQVRHAIATLGKREPVDARAEVEAAVGPKIRAEGAKIGPALTKALNMREGVTNLWTKAHITQLMSKVPETWIVFDPCLAQMGPVDYSNPSSISVTIGMVAQTFITNTEAQNRVAEAVPYLNLVSENPVTELRIPVIANLAALNSTLQDRAFLVTSKMGTKVKVTQPRIELADNGLLHLSANINALSGTWGKGISGRVTLQARPMVDCPTQKFGFTDVKMTVDTREAFSGTAAWLLEEMFVKAIARELRVNLNDYLPTVENEIYKVINAAKVPDHLKLVCDKPEVSLLGVYTIRRNGWNEAPSPGIVFVFGAKSNISVSVLKL